MSADELREVFFRIKALHALYQQSASRESEQLIAKQELLLEILNMKKLVKKHEHGLV